MRTNAAMRAALFLSAWAFGSLLSCSPAPASTPRRAAGEPLASSSAASAPPPRPVASKPKEPPDPCTPLGPNEVSEDDTPSIAGSLSRTKAAEWLAARGSSKAAFRSFVRAYAPAALDDSDADLVLENEGSCRTLTVGDKGEDAMVCEVAERTSIMRYSALAFVVRNKRIAPVLEVGFALPAMDWADARWLDLQVAFSPDGLEVDVRDRAAPGTVLVESPSSCRDYFARYLACEKAHRDGTPLEEVCPRMLDRANDLTFGHLTPKRPPSPMGGDRVELFGCAEAIPRLDRLLKESGPGSPFAAEFRADRLFALKSCKARGHYVWNGDRFVRSSPVPR